MDVFTRCALISAVTVLGACLAEVAATEPTPARQSDGDELRFVFDDGVHLSPPLQFQFFRPRTVELPGKSLAAHEPRFQDPMHLAPAAVLEAVRPTSTHTTLLGSGLDHDGETPLLVLYDRAGYVDVFTVSGEALLAAEQTGVGRNRTFLDVERPDLLQGAVPDRAYEPECAAICHGYIVVFCVVSEPIDDPNGAWWEIGTAFITSQDAGRTWQLVYEDEPVDEGWRRGREWSMQNWWPMERETPLEAFFTAADYRYNTGAQGGRTYLFRATRSAPGAPWAPQPTVVVYEASGLEGEHFHVSGVAPLAAGGMSLITSVGDSQWRNRVVNQTRADRNYTAAGWTTIDDYHGKKFSDGDVGTLANQFVGCAPGPNEGDMLVGADLICEQIVRFAAEDLDQPHPRTEFVYGRSLAEDNARAELFVIRTPTPELGGPYAARYSPRSSTAPPASKRLLYSPDGIAWAQVFAESNDDYRWPMLHGEHIYLDSFVNSSGLRRLPVPELRRQRPLRVGGGGCQRTVTEPLVASGPAGDITSLEKNEDGLWLFQGEPLDPQPPCTGQVFHITASRFDSSTHIGDVWLCGNASDVGDLTPGHTLQMRGWLMNNLPDAVANPGIQLRSSPGAIVTLRRPHYASVGTWHPVQVAHDEPLPQNARLYLRILSTSSSATTDVDLFWAIDNVVEGAGCADYPLPQDDSNDGSGLDCPDEEAAISGFACGDAWTLTLVGQLPPDSWDASFDTTKAWVLATVWGDDQNYIELIADTEDESDCHLAVSVIRDGVEVERMRSERIYWLRETALLISLAAPGDGEGLQVSVSFAGGPVQEMSGAAGALPVTPPREIRLKGQSPTAEDEAHITPMLWWGGEIAESTYLDAVTRAERLRTLPFLTPPILLGDFDNDGDVDQADLAHLIAAYKKTDAGDLDGDGDTDQADLAALLANYGVGT